MSDPLLQPRPEGLYCPAGDFFIDPMQPVARAVVTHAHADHARSGSGRYDVAAAGLGLMRERLGDAAAIDAHGYGETFHIGPVTVSLHPAGHVLGSAQVRMELDGRVVVVSGDYKRDPDPTCTPFEPVPCDVFVTESTFGLPVYRWPPMGEVIDDLLAWWDDCVRRGVPAVLFCYALGKAQRILAELAARTDRTVHLHGAMLRLVEQYREAGVRMVPTAPVSESARGRDFAGELIMAPPSAAGSPWMKRFAKASTGFASGWMQIRGSRRRRGYDRGFVVSDHADWPGLLQSVQQSGASRIYVTHGDGETLIRHPSGPRPRRPAAAPAARARQREWRLMRRFAELYAELDRTASTVAKREAIAAYLREAPAADAAWAVHVLGGAKLRRLATSTELRQALAEATGYADWLIDESYQHVGDLAETIALMLPPGDGTLGDVPLHAWLEQRLPALAKLESAGRIATLQTWWRALKPEQVFLLNKLITGALRVGVSQRLVVQALAAWSGQPTDLIAHRLSGTWKPTARALAALAAPVGEDEHLADRPYPFFLASPLESEVAALGDPRDWLAEWKWDGIRAQLMWRDGRAGLWSRGEERLDGRFPEIEQAAATLPTDGVLDGELLAWDVQTVKPLPFTALQKRIGKLKPGPKLLAGTPVRFMAYDLIECAGEDLRERPLHERRARLTELLGPADEALMLSPALLADAWDALTAERTQSRERQTEGLMLKRLDSPYRVGRKLGDWWKWKVDPHTIDAVLLYAQPGHGRRSGLFTDYSFGVWHEGELVTVAKAYSGLDDAEITRLDRWIRAHTTERFGPVRAVEPVHVFELAFEAVQLSGRHKSGVAVRFPRIARWRTDKQPADADHLDDLRRLATG